MMNQFTLVKKWQSNISSVCIFLKVSVGDIEMDVIKTLKKNFRRKRCDLRFLGSLKLPYLDNYFCGLSTACQYFINYLQNVK